MNVTKATKLEELYYPQLTSYPEQSGIQKYDN